VDAGGNLFIADQNNHRIRRVDVSGTISTLTGTGVQGFSGDGGPAGAAQLGAPAAVDVDAGGSVYASGNGRVRRVRDTRYTLGPLAAFGSQTLNVASVPRAVTLTNRGPEPLSVTGVTITGANPGQFSQTNNCGIVTFELVETTCTISVVFRPTSAGVKSALLNVSTVGMGTKSVSLSGDGGATFSVDPTSHAFAPQPITTASASKAVTVSNTGTVALPINNVRIVGTNANQFSQSHNCGASLPIGASCVVQVVFQPTTAGAKSANLNITGGSGAGSRIVSVSGTGLAPSYSLSVSSLAFGNQQVAVSSAGMLVTVTNNGANALPITSINDSGTNASQFTLTHNCPASVPVGASCEISVVFRPTTVGAKTATLNVNAGSGAGTKNVSLSGTGIVPTYALFPTVLAFANQAVGIASPPIAATLTNTGSLTLPINNITRSGTNANQFSLTHSCGASLAPGASCSINVTFLPTTAGVKAASVNVVGGASAGTQSMGLSGTGVTPAFSRSPTALAFGSQLRNTSSAAQFVTVTNTGTVQLTITSVTISGPNPGQFSQTNGCASPLTVGASCTISVVFRPTSAGAKTANLNVNAGGGAGTQSVTLAGTGT
jgi:hypothetical protein